MSMSEMITYSTVLIKCEYDDGSCGTGTGFVIDLCDNEVTGQCIPVIITNKHVVQGSKKCIFEFCIQDSDGNPIDTQSFGWNTQMPLGYTILMPRSTYVAYQLLQC